MFLLKIKIKTRKAEQRGAVPEGLVALAGSWLCAGHLLGAQGPRELRGLGRPPRRWPRSRAVSAGLGSQAGLGMGSQCRVRPCRQLLPTDGTGSAGTASPACARCRQGCGAGTPGLAWPVGLGLWVCQWFCFSEGLGQGFAGNSLCSLQLEFSLQALQGSAASPA